MDYCAEVQPLLCAWKVAESVQAFIWKKHEYNLMHVKNIIVKENKLMKVKQRIKSMKELLIIMKNISEHWNII